VGEKMISKNSGFLLRFIFLIVLPINGAYALIGKFLCIENLKFSYFELLINYYPKRATAYIHIAANRHRPVV
jgi:hypothetical protein